MREHSSRHLFHAFRGLLHSRDGRRIASMAQEQHIPDAVGPAAQADHYPRGRPSTR